MQMYFVAIVMPAGLDKKILEFQKWMAAKYNCNVALKSPAHITIVPPFWMEQEKEEQLKAALQNITETIQPFVICTDDFSAFKPRTLFVSIKDNQQLKQVKTKTDDHFKSTCFKIKTDDRSFHPHITIATRDLRKKDFADAWPYFGNKSFEEAFEASGLSLLKHNGSTWDAYYTAGFSKLF